MTIEEIQALLEKKFAGERKDGLRMLARTIAMTAGDTDDEKTKEKIEAMTAESVKDFIKEWRKDADAETTKAVKTNEQTLREKYDFVEKNKKDPEPPKGGEGNDDIAAIVKAAVAEATKPFAEKLAAYESKDTRSAQRAKVEKLFEGKNVNATFKKSVLAGFDNRTFEKDDDFENYLKDTQADVDACVQELADKGLAGFGSPDFGGGNAGNVDKAVEDYIKDKAQTAEGSNPLGGKKV